ncbi:MAG: hypothetical protein AB1791_00485 [Chloroflexota bacterium]
MDYLIPGLLGFFTGALIFGAIYPDLMPALTAVANYGAASLPDMLNLSTWLTVVVFVEMVVLLLYVLEKKKVARQDKLAE